MGGSLMRFFIGLLCGVALTLVALDRWGAHLDYIMGKHDPMRMLAPIEQPRADVVMPKSSTDLPAPILPGTLVSPPDPDWSFRPLNGQPQSLGGLTGSVVFMNFWSTSCLPCIAEMPGIEHLADSLKHDPVTFALVDTQEPLSRVSYIARHFHLKLPVYVSDSPPPLGLEANAVPTTYIIDRNGSVAFQRLGAANWDSDAVRAFIRRLAAQPTSRTN